MQTYYVLIFLGVAAIFSASGFYLYDKLKKDRELPALIGLFCMAMGLLLLVLDLLLIFFTHGPQHIPDYMLFNRLVSDSGFAGRWMLTVYLFAGTGVVIAIYLLARNLIKKFNNYRGKGNF